MKRVFVLSILVLTLLVVMFAPASARPGAVQISGYGYFAEEDECTDEAGAGADFAIRLTGDLEGCNYVTILRSAMSPSGTYREWGTEFYVITGGAFGTGTFETTYLATIKFDEAGGEAWGRCQHPLVAGSGTGDFEGVTGRLDYKDEVSDGIFIRAPYRGHLRW